jgi:hypothetical protein
MHLGSPPAPELSIGRNQPLKLIEPVLNDDDLWRYPFIDEGLECKKSLTI